MADGSAIVGAAANSRATPPAEDSESPNMSWRLAKKALFQVTSGPSTSNGDHGSGTGGSLEGADPELCITLLERGLNFTGLKARLKAADQEWMEHFITVGGIPALFDALETLGRKGFSSIVDAIRQLECVGCVRAVMNNRFGLEFIVEAMGETFVKRLTEGEQGLSSRRKKHALSLSLSLSLSWLQRLANKPCYCRSKHVTCVLVCKFYM